MTKFQTIFLGIFVLFMIIGLAAFAMYRSTSSTEQLPEITVWGTMPKEAVDDYMRVVNKDRTNDVVKLNYVEKQESSFDGEFIEALAKGEGPDAVLLPHYKLFRHEDKLEPISYDTISLLDYKNSYVEEAELYLTPEGVMALPFSIDPLVLYWNRDMYTNAGIATYPKTWESLVANIPKLTVKDANSNIQKSAIALGEFRNVTHAKEIMSALFFQSGNLIVQRNGSGIQTLLSDQVVNRSPDGSTVNPNKNKKEVDSIGEVGYTGAESALQFYASFADPAIPGGYTWNRSLPSSKTFFVAGKLANYIGFASEFSELKEKNPNLNFDISPLPQPELAKNRSSYANMHGFSIVKQSIDKLSVYKVLIAALDPAYMTEYSTTRFVPSVRRDVIALGSSDPYLTIFNDGALISKGWLDPDPVSTNTVFQDMVEYLTSGRLNARDALRYTSDHLRSLYGRLAI